MTNHVHLVAIPRCGDSLAHALGRVHSQYSQGFNRRYRRSGHLWQSRYFSCSLDRDDLVAASVEGSVPLFPLFPDYIWSNDALGSPPTANCSMN